MLKKIMILSFVGLVSSVFASVPDDAVSKATTFLQTGLTDRNELPLVLTRLSTTKDIRLLPIYAKFMQSDDDRVRLLATSLVARLADRQAVPLLKTRLNSDPSMRVRNEALSQLLLMDVLNADDLMKVVKVDDANLQVVAANALTKMGRFADVKPMLEKLSRSSLPNVSTFASMTLLGQGDRLQVARIKEVILDPRTQPEMIIAMLNQMRKEKIVAALPVAEYLAKSDAMAPVKIRAYMVISELAPNASDALLKAIDSAEGLSMKINILRLLTERKDSLPRLEKLAHYDSPVGALARFEMARAMKHAKREEYLEKVISYGHPIMIEYVFNRMQQDIDDKKPVDFYVQPVQKYILAQELESDRVTQMHSLLAFGVELLGKMNDKAANQAISSILQRHDGDPLKQLAIVALYAADNGEIVPMVAPSVKSPYPATKSYAAMLLAKFNDPAAIPALLDIQAAQATTESDIMALVDWYLLKFAGNTTVDASVNTILRSIK